MRPSNLIPPSRTGNSENQTKKNHRKTTTSMVPFLFSFSSKRGSTVSGVFTACFSTFYFISRSFASRFATIYYLAEFAKSQSSLLPSYALSGFTTEQNINIRRGRLYGRTGDGRTGPWPLGRLTNTLDTANAARRQPMYGGDLAATRRRSRRATNEGELGALV